MVRDEPAAQASWGRVALREAGRLLLESVVAGAFVSLVLALAVFIVASQAHAATPAADVPHGTLLLRDDGGAKAAAPLLFTDVHIDVSGLAARAKVTQRFVNPTAEWREGIYVFPLPERAAVDHLHMRIGTRVIEGQIKERQAARAVYEQAKTEGRKATLVEQERPNLFTTSVAHIGPNEEVVVSIEYQEKLHYEGGSFRLRFRAEGRGRQRAGGEKSAIQEVPARDLSVVHAFEQRFFSDDAVIAPAEAQLSPRDNRGRWRALNT